MRKATRQQTKTHNTRLVLKTIYEHGRPSRADIARITYLTRPTVSSIVADLINENLVIEDGPGPSAGGKRPTLLKINHDAHQLLCIDLGSKVFHGALVNLHGRITQRIDFPAEDKKQSEALQLMYDLINNLLAANSTPILGIAIGTPGLIDPQQGIVRRAVNLDWT
ncbi:MAG: ROK family protein, partial [Anaerolineae bacterium]